jgi:FtsP/CotA-like multicopper oxidase with cupredoxin domain
MNSTQMKLPAVLVGAAALALGLATSASAEVKVQCPPWVNDKNAVGPGVGKGYKCMHLSGGDGFAKMADGTRLYMFGFSDLTDATFLIGQTKNAINDVGVVSEGLLKANAPAPTVALDEGDFFYLSLTNVGMIVRPDLFDPHTVHYHGFPDASDIFDGVPEATIAINTDATVTYFYHNVLPGTYMYHCHVEATEHMQMGMLGNLYVRPVQNRLPDGANLDGWIHDNPDACQGGNPNCYDDPLNGTKYVYNDGDGSTRYDVEYPIQIGSWDGNFHDASEAVQPLPFAEMKDNYPLLNGRGYPDAASTSVIYNGDDSEFAETVDGSNTQKVGSLIEANVGERILLRISNLNVTNNYTLAVLGLKMKVVGRGARLLRGHGSTDLSEPTFYYDTTSVTLGGGEAVDAIIDTAGVSPGTYLLYTTNLNYLSNNQEDLGGMMTEIVIN